MKRVLITGANSYIGCSFEKYLSENYPDDYIVDTVDMHGAIGEIEASLAVTVCFTLLGSHIRTAERSARRKSAFIMR